MLYKGFRIPYIFHSGIQIFGTDPDKDHQGNAYYCDVFAQEDRKGQHRLHSFHLVDGRDFTTASNAVFEEAAKAILDKSEDSLNKHRERIVVEREETMITPEFRKRVAIYCRSCTYDYGATTQQKSCLKAIAAKPNWEHYAGYIDHIPLDPVERPDSAFRQLLRDAKAGCFDVVVVDSLSNWGENPQDILYFYMLLQHWNISVYFVTEKLDLSDVGYWQLNRLKDLIIPEATERYPNILSTEDIYQ